MPTLKNASFREGKRNKLLSQLRKLRQQTPSPLSSTPPVVLPAYIINWIILLDDKSIGKGVAISNSFKYHSLNAMAIKKAQEKSNCNVTQHPSLLTISCAGNLPDQETHIEDETEWKNFTEVVEIWLKEKRKNITVSIQLFFECLSLEAVKEVVDVESNEIDSKKKRRRRGSTFSDSSSTTPSTSSSTDAPPKKKSKTKATSKLIALKSASKVKKSKSSATSRQKIRAMKAKKLRHGLALMKRWLCDYTGCSNRNHHCYQPFGEDGKHYKLYNDHISSWYASISTGDATVDSPPPELKSRLYLMKNRKEETGKKRGLNLNADNVDAVQPLATPIQLSNIHAAPTNSTPFATFLPYNFTSNFQPYLPPYQQQYPWPFYHPTMPPYQQQYPWPFYHPTMPPYQQSPMHLPYQQVYQLPQPSLSPSPPPSPPPPPPPQSTNKPTSETPTFDRLPPSSPVRIDGDADDLVQEFIDWQISKNPQREDILMEVKNKLHNEMFELEDIHSANDEVWFQLQIPIGLGRRLRRDVKSFRLIVK